MLCVNWLIFDILCVNNVFSVMKLSGIFSLNTIYCFYLKPLKHQFVKNVLFYLPTTPQPPIFENHFPKAREWGGIILQNIYPCKVEIYLASAALYLCCNWRILSTSFSSFSRALEAEFSRTFMFSPTLSSSSSTF